MVKAATLHSSSFILSAVSSYVNYIFLFAKEAKKSERFAEVSPFSGEILYTLKGVPKFLRRVDTALKNIGINERVPYNAPLIQLSWMGGDHDVKWDIMVLSYEIFI
jgi:hypothetical protein